MYNGKLAQRETFANFVFCWAFANLLLQNISFNAYFLSVSDGIHKCFLTNDLRMAISRMFSYVPISCYNYGIANINIKYQLLVIGMDDQIMDI